MGINTTQKIRMFFVKSGNELDADKKFAITTFNQIASNKALVCDKTSIKHLSLSIVGEFPVIEFDVDSHNFWLERWGLRAIQENVDDWDIIKGWPREYWHDVSDFCKHFNCILELQTGICPLEGTGHREIYGHDGILWFEEIEYAPNYGKTTVQELYDGYKRYQVDCLNMVE